MALKTGIVKGEIFLKHIPGEGCPDTPQRLKSIYSMLNDSDMQGFFIDVLPQKADKEVITLFHSPEYFEKIAETKEKNSSHSLQTPMQVPIHLMQHFMPQAASLRPYHR